ncbi:hypothetical protein DL766_003314 [Monosporascus sp. MC13-8B]|uniref:Uncharacterized protein n=1 Tax=Monosporascus cannonballus TaxID=155416 RepID=A0ABY0HB49_9PEZI|nr:hypothetical protein DL763_010838 [Monosporascus cannonballus]RYO87278.1 hypothetical protein DL762_004323 [Monosporascus cannonballus]RYP33725.1 hypothetical protein DL766_003314 [Monosporascus sp. MC13-8B]
MNSESIIEERPALASLKNPERDVDWSSGNGIVNPFGANPEVVYRRSGAAVSGTLLGDTVSLSAHHLAVAQEGPAPPLEAPDWDKLFENYARDHAQEQSVEDSSQMSQPTAPTGVTVGPQLYTPPSSINSNTQPPSPLGKYFPASTQEPVSGSLLTDPQLFAFDRAVGAQQPATPPTDGHSKTQPPNHPDEASLADVHDPVVRSILVQSPIPFFDHGAGAQPFAIPPSSGNSETRPPNLMGECFPALSQDPVLESPLMDPQLAFDMDLQFNALDYGVGAQPAAIIPSSGSSETQSPNSPGEDFLADWHGTVSDYHFLDSPFPVLDHGVNSQTQLTSGIAQSGVQPPHLASEAQDMWSATDISVGDLQSPTWLPGQMLQQHAPLSQGNNYMGQLHNVPQKDNTPCYAPQGSFLPNGVALPPQGPQLDGDASVQGHPVPLDPNSRDGIMQRVYVDPKDGDTLYILDKTARQAPGQAGGVVRDLLPMEGVRLTKHHPHALPIVIECWLQSRRNQRKLAKSRRQNGGKWQVRVAEPSA